MKSFKIILLAIAALSFSACDLHVYTDRICTPDTLVDIPNLAQTYVQKGQNGDLYKFKNIEKGQYLITKIEKDLSMKGEESVTFACSYDGKYYFEDVAGTGVFYLTKATVTDTELTIKLMKFNKEKLDADHVPYKLIEQEVSQVLIVENGNLDVGKVFNYLEPTTTESGTMVLEPAAVIE